jgi:pyruvate formate lyase activating enzyme
LNALWFSGGSRKPRWWIIRAKLLALSLPEAAILNAVIVITLLWPWMKIPAWQALEFLALRKNFLDGVCITGGEPLIEPGLADFIGQVKALGYKIKLDTNGSFPERLKPLLDQKLVDYVALDIKTSRKKYHEITGLAGSHEKVEASVRLLLSSGVECEFRTTVFSHLDENDFHEIASWLGKGQNYYLQKGRGNLLHLSEEFIKKHNEVGAEQLERMAGVLRPHFNKVGIR